MGRSSLFNNLLMVAADTPAKLRPTDVGRVLLEAHECKCFDEFKEWLLSQELKDRTRDKVLLMIEDDFEEETE